METPFLPSSGDIGPIPISPLDSFFDNSDSVAMTLEPSPIVFPSNKLCPPFGTKDPLLLLFIVLLSIALARCAFFWFVGKKTKIKKRPHSEAVFL